MKRGCGWWEAGLAGCAALGVLVGCKPGAPEGAVERAMPVRMEEAAYAPVEEVVDLVGTLSANESVEIRPETAGVVKRIGFEEGQTVEKGQVLIETENDDLRAQVAEAEANLVLAESNFSRVEQLTKQRAVAKQDYDEASSRLLAARAVLNLVRTRLEKTIIEAPFAGVVGARNISPGQFVDSSTAITTLVDDDPLRADFHVPERFISELREGRKVRLKSPAWPGEAFEGEVYFLSPVVAESTRTVLLRAWVPNSDSRLKPGMFVSLDLVLARRQEAVVVPEEALTIVSGAPTIFAVEGGVARARTVKTGFRMPGKVEIIEGVNPGETIIVAGQQKVRDGTPVVDLRRAGSGAPGK